MKQRKQYYIDISELKSALERNFKQIKNNFSFFTDKQLRNDIKASAELLYPYLQRYSIEDINIGKFIQYILPLTIRWRLKLKNDLNFILNITPTLQQFSQYILKNAKQLPENLVDIVNNSIEKLQQFKNQNISQNQQNLRKNEKMGDEQRLNNLMLPLQEGDFDLGPVNNRQFNIRNYRPPPPSQERIDQIQAIINRQPVTRNEYLQRVLASRDSELRDEDMRVKERIQPLQGQELIEFKQLAIQALEDQPGFTQSEKEYYRKQILDDRAQARRNQGFATDQQIKTYLEANQAHFTPNFKVVLKRIFPGLDLLGVQAPQGDEVDPSLFRVLKTAFNSYTSGKDNTVKTTMSLRYMPRASENASSYDKSVLAKAKRIARMIKSQISSSKLKVDIPLDKNYIADKAVYNKTRVQLDPRAKLSFIKGIAKKYKTINKNQYKARAIERSRAGINAALQNVEAKINRAPKFEQYEVEVNPTEAQNYRDYVKSLRFQKNPQQFQVQ